MALRLFVAATLCVLVWPATAMAGPCSEREYKGANYVVCQFSTDDDIRLFLNSGSGAPYGHFNFLNDALAKDGEVLLFAMNAGMYHEDRSPVGLYVEAGGAKKSINNNDGPGNFHLKPNGVFWVTQKSEVRDAGVSETSNYLKAAHDDVAYATQSGPMLVIDDEIHPRFLPHSASLKRRNGVGVSAQGDVYFVLADSPVRFYDFATFFRDALKTPNALYLDGTISRLYAPELGRNDPGLAMGPIVGVVRGHD